MIYVIRHKETKDLIRAGGNRMRLQDDMSTYERQEYEMLVWQEEPTRRWEVLPWVLPTIKVAINEDQAAWIVEKFSNMTPRGLNFGEILQSIQDAWPRIPFVDGVVNS